MATIETIRRVRVQQISEGADTVRRDLLATADAQGKLASASEATAISTEVSSRRQLSAAAAFDRVRRSVDDSFRAQQVYERNLKTMNLALQQGAVEASTYDRTLGLLQSRYGGIAAASQRAADAQRAAWKDLGSIGAKQLENLEYSRKVASMGSMPGMGAASGNRLRGDQVQNLAYQASDVVSSLGSGSSLTQVALAQGPQIAQVFGGPGGASVRGAFAQAGEAASGLAARVGIVGAAIGTVTAAFLTGVAAQVSYANGQRELQQGLQGIGRASGTTVGQINALAPAAASAGNVSVRSAREMAGAFAATGKIGAEMYAGLIATTRDYATTTGQELPDASKALAEAFADPAKGAEVLNAQLGFLNEATRQSIERLQAQGDRLGAQRTLLDAYRTGLTSATELTSGWGRATAAAGTIISNTWDAVGQAIDRVATGGDLETRMATAQKVLENSRARQNYLPFGIGTGDTAAAQAEVTRLQAEADKRRQQSEQAQRAQSSLMIGGIVQSADPARQELKKVQDQAEQLRKAISDPIKFGLDRSALSDTTSAFDTLSRAARNMADEIGRFGSVAVAALNRTAEFNNRTATYAPSARSAAQIENNYAEQERNAGGREIAGLRRARDLELETLRTQTTQATGAYRTNLRDVPEQYRDRVYGAATRNGIDPNLLSSVFYKESRFRPEVISGARRSSAGAEGAFQFMPDTARQYGVNTRDFDSSANGAARLLQDRLRARNGDVGLALADYNWGQGNVNRVGGDASRFPRETRDYIAQITRGTPGTTDQVQELDANARAVRLANDNLKANTELYGRNGLQLDATTRANSMLSEQLARGVPLTDALKASIGQFANETATAAQRLRLSQFASDTGFDREQLGRSQGDQVAYARARSVVGDTGSPQAQMVIEQSRLNDNLRETRSLATDAFGGMLTDLRRGTSLMDSLRSAVGRLADRALNAFADRSMAALFGGFGGSGGGASSGLASLFTGGDFFPSFANGGIMTSAGKVPLNAYAGGGIANSPQMALFGEGRMPEAYVPLPDGKTIPVTVQMPANGNGAGTSNIIQGDTVTVQVAQTGASPEAIAAAIARNNEQRDRTLAARLADHQRRRG